MSAAHEVEALRQAPPTQFAAALHRAATAAMPMHHAAGHAWSSAIVDDPEVTP